MTIVLKNAEATGKLEKTNLEWRGGMERLIGMGSRRNGGKELRAVNIHYS